MSQIAMLADVVGEELAARKYPYKVTYAPERVQRTGPGASLTGVVFERDLKRGDSVGTRLATRQGAGAPRSYYARGTAGAFTVYVQSPKPGARARDHEAEVDLVCDAVISAMVRACKLAGKPLAIGSSRLLGAEDFAGSAFEQWPGAAARVEFSVSVPVRDVDYRGRGPGTGVVFAVENTYEAALVADPGP